MQMHYLFIDRSVKLLESIKLYFNYLLNHFYCYIILDVINKKQHTITKIITIQCFYRAVVLFIDDLHTNT